MLYCVANFASLLGNGLPRVRAGLYPVYEFGETAMRSTLDTQHMLVLVFTQLNMPKTCYPVPQKEAQDGKVKGVTDESADARRSPDTGGPAQPLVALGEPAPAVPAHRRRAHRPPPRGCGRSSWLPF